MAVQAQYPSNALILNRSEQERKSMEFSQAPTGFRDQSGVFFSNGASGNPRKRGREAAPILMESSAQGNSINDLLSLQPPPAASLSAPTVISLAQLQARPPPLVSTGLRLAFEDQHQLQNHNQANPLLSASLFPVLSDDLALQLNQHQDEFDRFLRAHGEHLRRTLAEKRQRHCRALLCAADEAAARRLREKEAEVEQAVRRAAELEERLARLKAESLAWQAKAMADQATALALHAQLQQAQAAAAEEREGECRDSPAEDAESAHVDPDRAPPAACRSCRSALASVVVLPCRHLCLCTDCSDAAPPCPVCRCATTGSLPVFFS
ncbi:probable BOI-related E3 ubiquitin-protein ligase 3 [Phoenix dactylifera]|uniref:Probable BOI-related E3 ubiquitin-protein ligase 3 n=1 Tax=Phoenix dactylifera TaxID=42345 RepID=A0A8B8ZR06_PHODC|nr:probable BOI-related E3 ubiquitin-protein ligase 3 [Phoenix dactylifera]XP_038973933.1 probable BOI-related E3 ubiquitin-protein ligase 3 [Phoenix dactylifera]